MATINELTALTSASANDLLPIWDTNAGAGVEPTKKIGLKDMTSSMIKAETFSETTDSSSNLVFANYKRIILAVVFTTQLLIGIPMYYWSDSGVPIIKVLDFNFAPSPNTAVSGTYYYLDADY